MWAPGMARCARQPTPNPSLEGRGQKKGGAEEGRGRRREGQKKGKHLAKWVTARL